MVDHDNLGMAVADQDEPARVWEPKQGIVSLRPVQQGQDTTIGIGDMLYYSGKRHRASLRGALPQVVPCDGESHK